MSGTPEQLTFDLPFRSALGREDFLVSRSNTAAVALVDAWPAWAHWAGVVAGEAGSGKSHLVTVWQARSEAVRVSAPELSEALVASFAEARALAVEDLHAGIGDERVLFHLLNLAREHRLSILLTSRRPPGELAIALPDLRSRLRAIPIARIEPPDEALLGALLVKLFADRQLAVEPHVVSYIARHIARSTEAATGIVAELDRRSLATRRKVTRALAAELLRRDEPTA
jgi:chromosomal replication initiation ATPase DnaA